MLNKLLVKSNINRVARHVVTTHAHGRSRNLHASPEMLVHRQEEGGRSLHQSPRVTEPHLGDEQRRARPGSAPPGVATARPRRALRRALHRRGHCGRRFISRLWRLRTFRLPLSSEISAVSGAFLRSDDGFVCLFVCEFMKVGVRPGTALRSRQGFCGLESSRQSVGEGAVSVWRRVGLETVPEPGFPTVPGGT